MVRKTVVALEEPEKEGAGTQTTRRHDEEAMSEKARNGAGTVERRGALWWVQVSMPKAPGERRARRPRVPIPDSEKMTELQAQREGAKLAWQVRTGKLVFDPKPRRGAIPALTALTTVRELGKSWTSGEMFTKYGSVNRLRVKATAATDAWTMAKHVYEVHTRGPSGPVFGDLPVSSVTSDDVALVMASHSKDLA